MLCLAYDDIADATVHVYGCSCGRADCWQHPTLTLILKRYAPGKEPY